MKRNLKTVAIAAAAAILSAVVVAWAAQNTYLGTVFIADTTTPSQQLKVNADGSVNVDVTGGSGGTVTANQGSAGSSPWATGGSYFTNVVGSALTRASNTTTYTANTTVCLNTSVTACAPGTIPIANANAGKGMINRVTLLKSSSTTTNATFTIWFFSAAPGVASPAQYDDVAYVGPRSADMPNYIGNASCTTPVVTSDTSAGVWYECTLSNPNTSGALDFQALSGSTNINYLISVTAAYAPASGETFIPYVSGFY